jgi:hypothetical protein
MPTNINSFCVGPHTIKPRWANSSNLSAGAFADAAEEEGMRSHWLIGAAALALLMQISPSAQAGLIGNGTNSVAALFYLGASSVPAVTSSTAPYTNPAPTEIEGPMGPTNPSAPPSVIPAHFPAGPIDLSTIDVGDTQITITNQAPPSMPFCTVTTTPCPDVFTGFGFVFFGNVDITNVTVDPASSPAFLPIAGGLNFGATDIFANVVGDAPNIGDQLILDVTTAATVPSLPEPWSLALLASGLVGLLAIERRAKRGSGAISVSS